MSHHYVVDCREEGMEKWETERQSCSLMACKVISCGLVKLRAASLGCNSWQSCPPFTLANPSFRAFSHHQIFMERGRKRGLDEARKKNYDDKKGKLQSGTRWKEISNGNQTPSRLRLFWRCWRVLWALLTQAAEHFCVIIQLINMAAGYCSSYSFHAITTHPPSLPPELT